MGASPSTVVVTDASVLVNFLRIDRTARSRRFGALLRAACVKRTITRRERPLNAASVRAGTWRFSQASPLSLPNPRRLAQTGSLCCIRPGDVQRRCPFLAQPSEAR